jgi:predicted DNA-binding protein YlxM (UPF0122 family)
MINNNKINKTITIELNKIINLSSVIKNVPKSKRIIDGIKNNKSFSDIALKNNCSRQAIHKKFVKICDYIITKQPELKTLYDNFDTYLDINNDVDVLCTKRDSVDLWKKIILRLVLLKNKNVFSSSDRINYLMDSKLYYKRFKTKTSIDTTLSCKFLSDLKPIMSDDGISYIEDIGTKLYINNIASRLGLTAPRLKSVIGDVFDDDFFFVDDYLLPVNKRGVFRAMELYCHIVMIKRREREKSISDGIDSFNLLEHTYTVFNDRYNSKLVLHSINSYGDFITYLNSRKILQFCL